MPRRDDLQTILLIGSGPIIIGQACEFDYSGTQACRVLRDEGYRVVLVNSNPATIMTDPEFADATYVEPLNVRDPSSGSSNGSDPTRSSRRSAARPALNLAIALDEAGVLDAFNVEMIGASVDAIRTAEDRQRFKTAMGEIGLGVPRSGVAYALDEAVTVAAEVGYPGHRPPVVHPRRRRNRHRPPTTKACRASPSAAWPPARSRRSSSSGRCAAGRSSNSR